MMVMTNKTRRIESRDSFTNVGTHIRNWLRKLLKKQDSFFYHCMNHEQYSVALRYLEVKKIEGKFIYERYTLEDDNPSTCPKSLIDVFGDRYRQLFNDYGIPSTNSCELDQDGEPVPEMATKTNENTADSVDKQVEQLLKLATLNTLKQFGGFPSIPQGPVSNNTPSVPTKSVQYTWNFLREHDGFQGSILVDEKSFDGDITVKQFLQDLSDTSILNIFCPTESAKNLIDDKKGVAQIVVGRGEHCSIFSWDTFKMMKMCSVIAMIHFADVAFFSFKIEKLSKSEETLSTSLL